MGVEKGFVADIPSGWYYYYTGAVLAPKDIHYALIGPVVGTTCPDSPEKRIACYKYGGELPSAPETFYVTTHKDVVTCQDCLELIHA